MNLEFLSPVIGDPDRPAESPMLAAAQRAGATAGLRDGWSVPVGFGDGSTQRRALAETVGFSDASALTKTELNGTADAVRGCGVPEFGVAIARDGAWWCPLTPNRVLVLGAAPKPGDLLAVDVSSQYCALRIEGPLARELMARFCALDLRPTVAPPGAVRPGSVARTPGLVLVEAPQRLLILVGAALGEYLWTVVDDAARRLGGQPVDADLLADHTVTEETSGDA